MPGPDPGGDQAPPLPRLTPGVWAVGAASFFSDSGHEIVTSVLPSFVTSVLGWSAAALGAIEGVSDALTGVAKVVGGPLADDPERRRSLATGGYLLTAVATAAIGLATAVWQVGLLRAVAWAARGIRTPARDALLGSLADPRRYGRAFGVERAGDNLGAVAGPLAAAALVAWLGIRPAMWLAVVPGLLAAAAITVAARETRRLRGTTARQRVRRELSDLRAAGIARPLLPIALFECGNLATTLLILRATDALTSLGVAGAASLAIVLYAGHNAIAALVAPIGGVWLDRSGPRVVFGAGAAVYVVAYALLAADSVVALVAGFALAGAGIGLAETAEGALVARLLPDRLRGSGFGLLGGVQAAGDLVATVVAGVLYTIAGPIAAFGYAAAWMLLSVAASALIGPTPPAAEPGGRP